MSDPTLIWEDDGGPCPDDGRMVVSISEPDAAREVAEAAEAFVRACSVYGDDGEFQIQAWNAAEEGKALWSAVEVWCLVRHFAPEETR